MAALQDGYTPHFLRDRTNGAPIVGRASIEGFARIRAGFGRVALEEPTACCVSRSSVTGHARARESDAFAESSAGAPSSRKNSCTYSVKSGTLSSRAQGRWRRNCLLFEK